MTQIVLMIPRVSGVTDAAIKSKQAAIEKNGLASTASDLPWITGECQLHGYRFMITADSVTWSTDVEVDAEVSSMARRTIHAPKASPIQITKQVDAASAALTKSTLMGKVFDSPWEIYFMRTLGGEPGTAHLSGKVHVRFFTLRLHHALITRCSHGVDEGTGVETLEVSPAAIEWVYRRMDETNEVRGFQSVRYNVQTGTVG
ncbi:type VI secretion system tube protein Hcp [Arenibaculum pallidiluteum]|uniref:type VI secretion system tube protein Hcp n=1 Tax=Arenibaculum pallidiluteum TaxID=2812559 RepID=UPI001A96051E|nr:type VI secretion system tube protein Hcp [Arenibaculum pallidiluteum]